MNRMNLGELVAIDIHTHAETSTRILPDEVEREMEQARGRYFRYQAKHPTIAQMAEYYRARKMAFVVFSVDAERGMGFRGVSNEEVAESAAKHADVAIPFASVDPNRGAAGVRLAKKLINEYGVKGFKFHPTVQAFAPNDRICYPLYEAIAEAGLPALFHSGQTGIGAGMPGGGGLRLEYSNPMLLDAVAADFPQLAIVSAHPGVPWQDEQLAVAGHKPNVYIDLSGWSPKYFPPILVRYINSILQDKMLFGSDWPVITPDRWLADFAKLDIREEIRSKVLKANARKILGI